MSITAAELRGASKPSLTEALGWIGSRVDDIYGAGVGRLEDVWIDPGTGTPRWLLVKEGRFGGRTTLIPFEDATAGAGHVWIPYEREIVREAPEVHQGAPLTQQIEAQLRAHYEAASRGAGSRVGQSAQAAAPEVAIQHAHAPPHQHAGPGPEHTPAPPRHQAAPYIPQQQYSPPQAGRPGEHGWQQAYQPRQVQQTPPPQPIYQPQPQQQAYQPQPAQQAPPPPPQPTHPPTQPHPPSAPAGAGYPEPHQHPGPPAPPAEARPPTTMRQAVPQHGAAAPPLASVPDPGDRTEWREPDDRPQQAGRPDGPAGAERATALPLIGELDRPYRVEIRFSGEISVSGDVSGLSISPLADEQT